MKNTNTINKIFLDSSLNLEKVSMVSLLFTDGKLISKNDFSIVKKQLNLTAEALSSVVLYQQINSGNYYEYFLPLKENNVTLPQKDRFGNFIENMTDKTVIVFVDGYKLSPTEFTVNEYVLTIKYPYLDTERSVIGVYVSDKALYLGQAVQQSEWNQKTRSFKCEDYDYNRYMIFKNGELIYNKNINFVNNRVTLNVEIKNTDIIDVYKFTSNITCLTFDGAPGYYSYGPTDFRGISIMDVYDTIATFDVPVKLAIDDVRYGFFICEEDGEGCVMIVDDEYETKSVKCIQIVPFADDNYTYDKYFLKVPNARSILYYTSQYDLNGTMFPELLGIFQTVLLDETYDSLKRMCNLRNINKVDSAHISKLMDFLGFSISTKEMSLARKHIILEQLTKFYEIVGTRDSYNFFNAMNLDSRLMDIVQLFTPKKDIVDGNEVAYRYVTFRSAEDLGAVTHTEYRLPIKDYGYVNMPANRRDDPNNMPRSAGTLADETKPAILSNVRIVKTMGDDGEIVTKYLDVQPNTYTESPVAGPNQPSIDYGSVTKTELDNQYDYGYVRDKVKGEWVEWTEWNRPSDWYPTNHVDVALEIPPNVLYDDFITEFKKTFYDIASAVVYIHSITEVYSFGKKKSQDESHSSSGVGFNILAVPVYHSGEYTFTSNPHIQIN